MVLVGCGDLQLPLYWEQGDCMKVKANCYFYAIALDAKRFETKYKKVSPAMKQGLVKKIYPLEELLLMRPLMMTID